MSTIRASIPPCLLWGRGALLRGAARRHGRRRNPARMTPRSSLRTPTNPALHSPQHWVEKADRSIKGSDTPQLATRGKPSHHGRTARRSCRHRVQALLQHRHHPARQGGLHRPRRKVRHNGCRDRRSRWPPPWSTLDMTVPTSTPSSSDLGFLRPWRSPRHRPPKRLRTPGRPSSNAANRPHQHRRPLTDTPTRSPRDTPNPRNYRGFTVSPDRSSGHSKRAAPPRSSALPECHELDDHR